MKLSNDDKLTIYELRKTGVTWSQLDQQYGVQISNLRYTIKLMDKYGVEIIRNGNNNKYYPPDLKQEMIDKVLVLSTRSLRRRKYSSYKGEIGQKADNLIKHQFQASQPYPKCHTDVTEFVLPNCSGKVYLSSVLDGYNSEIISFTLPRSLI